MKVTIVGLGLIGGSIAKDLKTQINVSVTGVDNNPEHLQMAMKLGLVHEVMEFDMGVRKADVIILAMPVDKIEGVLPEVLDMVDGSQVIIDVGSTKEFICNSVSGHAKRGRFVAAHPLAGTEYSGPAAAVQRLFVDKKNIICEKEKTDIDALNIAMKVFQSLGMKTYFLSPGEHDKHLAYVSHLSHVSSFMLGLTVLDIEKDERQIFNLASTGFASTVRLAKSNPQTWAAIFEKNNKHLSLALDSYIDYLKKFKQAIDSKDTDTTMKLMAEANDIRRILN